MKKLVGLLFCAGVAHADSRATVVDGMTMAPIENAVVRVAGETLVVTAPGYDDTTQEIAPGDEPTLVLMFAPGALDEIVEVVGRAPVGAARSGYALGKDEIRNLPGGRGDALAAVRSMPGIGSAPPLAAGRLVIRGGAPQDSLLEIDGVPVPFIYHAFDGSTILPVSMVGAINYSPGGFGVEEGRATSGVVGILTNEDTPSRATAVTTLSMNEVAAAAASPLAKKLSIAGGVRRSTVDLLLPYLPNDSPVEFTTPPKYNDAQLKLDWTPSTRDRVSLFGFTSYDQLGVVNTMPTDNDLPKDFATDMRFSRVIATWKHETPGVQNRLVAAAGNGDFHATYDTEQYLDDSHVVGLVRDDLSIAIGGRITLRGGVFGQLEKHELDARTIVIPPDGLPPGQTFHDLPIQSFAKSYDTSYGAVYLAADITPTASTTITAGARVDYFARISEAVLEPRIEVAQRAGSMILRASAGRYARDHSQAQAMDTSLSPELATQYSLGTDITLADGLTAKATAYYTAREQLAVDDPMSGDALAYDSTGTGSSLGVDLLLRYQRDDLFAWLAYSYNNTARTDRPGAAEEPTPYDQSHALTAVASYQLGAWRLGGRFQYASGLPYTDVMGGTYSEELQRYIPILGSQYGERYPDVVHFDVRIERTWTTRHVDLAAFVDFANVFRSERVHRYKYSDDYSERKAITEYMPLPSVGIRGEF